MAVDNPSYFSLSAGSGLSPSTGTTTTTATALGISGSSNPSRSHSSGLAGLFRRKTGCTVKMGSGSSSGSTVNNIRGDGRKVSSSTSGSSTPTEERVPMLPANGFSGRAGTQISSMQQRRSFRNLFRSVSANSDHEMTRQFLRGEPRPEDVAPPSPYLPHRSHSHSEKDKRRPVRRNRRVLKSASELLSNDMVYCGLPSEDTMDRTCVPRHYDDEDDDDDDEDENGEAGEVFLGVEDVRYYNLTTTIPSSGSAVDGHRRHSTGNFMGKESHCSGRKGIQDCGVLVEPETMAPPIPTEVPVDVDVDVVDGNWRDGNIGDRSRSRCRRHRSSSNKGSRSNTGLSRMDENAESDIVFVSSKESEVSSLWVNYLTACFEQIARQQGRPPFKVRHVTIEESLTISPTNRQIGEDIGGPGKITARLQIIVVCPILLGRIASHREDATNLARYVISAADRVLAMMLGVHEGHISDAHRQALPSYKQWRKFFVKDQDETFVGEFLGAAVAILGAAPSPALKSDKTAFSVHPKKVKLGQNRIVALLNDPLRLDDNVSVIVDRCGEAIEIAHVKRRNPYALQFSIPERCLDVSMLVGVRIFVNGSSLGVRQVKCESRLRELDQILRAHDNQLEFMCQTFGFNSGDREQLDNWMVHAFQRNLPPHFDLLSTPSGTLPAFKNRTSPEENPTLLHFAARFGLERLAWQLLECPGGDIACDLRNAADLTPADLAEQAGHSRLAHQLRGYMQMNEFTNMYSYLKGISENTAGSSAKGSDIPIASSMPTSSMASLTSEQTDREDYCCPRPLSEAYSVPPAARPLTALIAPASNYPNTSMPKIADCNGEQPNYSIVPTPTPVVQVVGSAPSPSPSASANGLDLPLQGYMKMQPAGPKTPTSNVNGQQSSRAGTPTQSSAPAAAGTGNGGHGKTREHSNSSSSAGPQDELLEIITDFKNNVFTISEVERLVENWRNRNDVQQSFKDKQRQLTAMREEYERIQKKLKDEMRAPTPFDRIRKFFSKGKKEAKDSTNSNDSASSTMSKGDGINGTLADRRPVSSLSLGSVSSSSSSGRMSTVSGCSRTSLGDSGTHSDTEDRRIQTNREDKAGLMCYEIPPAPKPFTGRYSPGPRYSPSPRSSTVVTVHSTDTGSRPSQVTANPRSNLAGASNEYYIAFPPSGLPVHCFKALNNCGKEPKTPSSPCDRSKHPLDFGVHGELSPNIVENNLSEAKQDNRYVNVDPPATSASSLPIPSPPPGMCIPDVSYTNIHSAISEATNPGPTKTNPGNSNDESSNAVDRLNSRGNTVVSTEDSVDDVDSLAILDELEPKITEDQSFEEIEGNQRTNNDNALSAESNNSAEYIETDRQIAGVRKVAEVSDFSQMPDYMNVNIDVERELVKIVDVLPKKVPSPPIPPRGVAKI